MDKNKTISRLQFMIHRLGANMQDTAHTNTEMHDYCTKAYMEAEKAIGAIERLDSTSLSFIDSEYDDEYQAWLEDSK